MVSSSSKLTQGELVQKCMKNSPVALVDIAVNLTDKAFDKDRREVLQRAKAAGVVAVLVTGCNVRSSRAAQKLCEEYQDEYPLYFTAGVHPHNAKECNEHTLDELRRLASHPRCVAVGECGLDFNRNFSPQDVQQQWFDAQVALAVELKKPLFMHCRDASDTFATILRRHQLQAPATVHCFTGSKEELADALDLGLHIGITGWVCDDRPDRGGADLAALLPSIPADRLMLETDAPYLVPRTIMPSKARPNRNEPALLPHVVDKVAVALQKSPEQVAKETSEVVQRVFGLPQSLFAVPAGVAAS